MLFVLFACAESDLALMAPPMPSASVPAHGAVDVPIDVWTVFAYDDVPPNGPPTIVLERIDDPDAPALVAEGTLPVVDGLVQLVREDDLEPDTAYRMTLVDTWGNVMISEFTTGDGVVVAPVGDLEAELVDAGRASLGWRRADVDVSAVPDPVGLVRVSPWEESQLYRATMGLSRPVPVSWPHADDGCVDLAQLDGHGEVVSETTVCEPSGCSTSGVGNGALGAVAGLLGAGWRRISRRGNRLPGSNLLAVKLGISQ